MNENKWVAITSTSWIYFDSDHTLKIITETGGSTINIYVDEATEPTTDVEGIITITANGKTFDKIIKRCSPTIINVSKTLDFCVYYKKVYGDNIVGPCENGTGKLDDYGVDIRNIKLVTVTTYSNNRTNTEEKILNKSNINVSYILSDETEYSFLPKNEGQDREITVKVSLNNDSTVFAPNSQQMQDNPNCYMFTQLGIKDSNGNIIEDRLHDIEQVGQSISYQNFGFNADSIEKESETCEADTYTFNITGEKVISDGGKTGLTECDELVSFGSDSVTHTDISVSDVTFSVSPEDYGSFNGNTLSYNENDENKNRKLTITATLNENNTITASTTFTVIAGSECGNPLYIIFKCDKENIDYNGNTANFTYYLAETETADENEAIKDTTINSCLNFVYPEENTISRGDINYSEGVFTVEVTFGQNPYDEQGKNWEFEVNCESVYVANNPQTINLYQSNKYEQIIPNCDYFVFHYVWDEEDGTDLDSLTRLSNCFTLPNHTSLSDYTVGYYGTSNRILKNTNTGKVYIEFGGDNQCHGSEYTIICLKDILEDYKKKQISFEKDEIWIDIYANWFTNKNIGKMTIEYDQYKGSTDVGYSEEINKKEMTDCEAAKYYSFVPNEEYCETVCSKQEIKEIGVKAFGDRNAIMAQTVSCIDNIYTHALRLKYNIPFGKTSIEKFVDTGVDTKQYWNGINTMIGGKSYSSAAFNTSDGNLYENVYIKHNVEEETHDVYLFDTDKDYVNISFRGKNKKCKKTDFSTSNEKEIELSNEDEGTILRIKFTINNDRTVNIKIDSMIGKNGDTLYISPYCNIDYLVSCDEKVMYRFKDITVRKNN